jgi:hypothetical protein
LLVVVDVVGGSVEEILAIEVLLMLRRRRWLLNLRRLLNILWLLLDSGSKWLRMNWLRVSERRINRRSLTRLREVM